MNYEHLGCHEFVFFLNAKFKYINMNKRRSPAIGQSMKNKLVLKKLGTVNELEKQIGKQPLLKLSQ